MNHKALGYKKILPGRIVSARVYLIAVLLLVSPLINGCHDKIAPQVDDEPLKASGTIQADKIRVASELGGRIINVTVRRGQAVKKGDVLVLLDATPLLTQLAEAEAAVTTAQADLALVKAGPRPEEIAATQAALALAKAERDGALAAWGNAQQVLESPQELDAQIAQARAQLELAVQGVELAEAQLAQEQLLRDQRQEGSFERKVSDLQVKAATQALAAAQADEKAAQTLLNWLWTIRNEPLGLVAQAHLAEGQYHIAEAGVVVSQARLEDLLDGPTPEEIAVAEAALRLAQTQADALRTQQSKFTLTSPVDGVVLDQALRTGEVAAPAATVLTVADLRQVTLTLYVPENQIGHVYLGQVVTLKVDSLPGQTFTGRVKHIAAQPEFTPRNVATQEERLNTFYAVAVSLPNEKEALKPGMPADAIFDKTPSEHQQP